MSEWETNESAIKHLQAFFLTRMNRLENCKHESIFTTGPGGEIIRESCYCGKKNLLHISPKLSAELSANSEFKKFHPGNVITDGKILKMFGVPVFIEKAEYFKEKKDG